METLVARWKAQKSAQKQHSMDDMNLQQISEENSSSVFNRTSQSNLNLSNKKRTSSAKKKEDHPQMVASSSTQRLANKENIILQQQYQHQQQQLSNKKIKVSSSQKSLSHYPQNSASKEENLKKNFTNYSPSKFSVKDNDDQLSQINYMAQSLSQGKLGSTIQIPPKPVKRSLNYILDEALYKIMDVFKHSEMNQKMSYQERVGKIRNILEVTVQTTQFMQNPKLQQLEEAEKNLQKMKQAQTQNLQDAHVKIINELENKLFEAERDKIHVKSENETLKQRLAVLEKQLESQKLNMEMWQSCRKSNQIIEKNNEILQEQLEQQRQQNADQQVIFDAQINEISEIINKLKEQMYEKTQREFSLN